MAPVHPLSPSSSPSCRSVVIQADPRFIEALTSVLDPNRRRLAVRMGPTTSVVRHEVVGTSDRVRRHFVILDTPGLPSNDMVTTPIRGKALNALIAILEERQARLLDEETKVVRRKSDGGELVHLGE